MFKVQGNPNFQFEEVKKELVSNRYSSQVAPLPVIRRKKRPRMFMMIDSLEAKPKLSVATHHQPKLSHDTRSKMFYLLAERSLILRK